MKKSKQIILTILTSVTVASCASERVPPTSVYDGYQYYGRSRDTGMVYSHYSGGYYHYFLWSRMFNGYGYYNPNYYGNGYYNAPRGFKSSVHSFSGSVPTARGLVGSHSTISRGGFGSSGYGFSARS